MWCDREGKRVGSFGRCGATERGNVSVVSVDVVLQTGDWCR
jgi:hypothetical protein